MKITTDQTSGVLAWLHAGNPPRLYSWASLKTGERSARPLVDLPVVDVIRLAKQNEFVGIKLMPHGAHLLRLIEADDIDHPVIVFGLVVDFLYKPDRAISGGEFFALSGNAEHVESLVKAAMVPTVVKVIHLYPSPDERAAVAAIAA